jgi:hypothetical protein
MSQSLTLANMDVYAYSCSLGHPTITPKPRIDSKVSSQSYVQGFSGNDYDGPYCLFQNNHQDTTKLGGSRILFGRSHLKNHFELHGKKITVDEHKRNDWIRSAADMLRDTKNSDIDHVLVMNELVHEDYYQASYRLIDKGLIKFEDGSYLKLMSTSTHTHKDIGDITLAVNQQGDVYINQGHICGRIIHFNTNQKELALTSATFLKNFTSDTDDEPWHSYTEDQNNKTNKQKF